MTTQSLQQLIESKPPLDPQSARKNGPSLRSVLVRMNETYKASSSTTPFKIDVPTETKKIALIDSSYKAEDTAFLDRLKTGIVQLRHTLKKSDASGSGLVNGAEFKACMIQSGYSHGDDTFVKKLFDANAEVLPDGYTIGTYSHWQGARDWGTRGKIVNIDKFIKKLETTKTESDSSTLMSAKAVEERRVLRKALAATRGSSNSCLLMRSLSSATPGRIEIDKLKEGLAALGANITPSEMDVVVERVGVKADGRVDIAEFDAKLRESVEFFDKVATAASSNLLGNHRRYHNSVRSKDDLIGPVGVNFNEFNDGITQSKVFKRDQLVWAKLQRTLQASGPSIVSSLAGAEGIPVAHVVGKLSDIGIQLGAEDVRGLETRLRRSMEGDRGDALVTLDAFCDVAGIKLGADSRGRPIDSSTRSIPAEGGVFHASRLSVLGNSSYSASMLRENKATDLGFIASNSKK